MTVHTLHPHDKPSKRPTVATPIIRAQAVDNALSALDDHIRMLRCTADSAALVDTNDGEMVEVLYFLHGKLRGEIDRLFMLL